MYVRCQLIDTSLETETWLPVYATKRVSASLVDLFQCLAQTAEVLDRRCNRRPWLGSQWPGATLRVPSCTGPPGAP